jgi:ubiquinone/menaquinone biosynthesis C-methylase UbiE
MAAEILTQEQRQHSQYIDFWNSVLVPKFIRWKHILVDGLTLHSEAIFPSLPVKPGDKVVDAGCGFGDTAMKLARLVALLDLFWLSIAATLFWSSGAKTRW